MNKFSLLLVLMSFVTFGCEDINVLAPKIENPNQPMILEYAYSYKRDVTNPVSTSKLTYKIDTDGSTTYLDLIHVITVNANCEMDPYSTVVDNGKNIELNYKDHVAANTVANAHTKNITMYHRYRIVQRPGENANTLNVRSNYEFANEDLRNGSVDNTLQYETLTINF